MSCRKKYSLCIHYNEMKNGKLHADHSDKCASRQYNLNFPLLTNAPTDSTTTESFLHWDCFI